MSLAEFPWGIGTLLSGTTVAITALVGVIKWYLKRKKQPSIREIDPITIQNYLSNEMMKAVEGLDTREFFTLDMTFPSGEVINVPMVEDMPMMVFENIIMSMMASTKDYTMVLIKCKGFGAIPIHSHSNCVQEVQIFEGTMTCLVTGKQYKKGDIWIIEPNQPHGELLHNCYALITYKPPLPTASERPVNLHSMESIFKKI